MSAPTQSSASRRLHSSKPEPGIRVLSVSSVAEDHIALRAMLDDIHTCELDEATTYRAALRRMDDVRIVICDTDLSDGGWKDLLHKLHSLSDPPLVIVTSRLADERLWAQVLNLGGYDLLAKPFNAREVFRTVSGALLAVQSATIAGSRRSELCNPKTLVAGAA